MLVFAEGLALGKESLLRAVLCRVPDYLPSAKGQALGKDDLSGSEWGDEQSHDRRRLSVEVSF